MQSDVLPGRECGSCNVCCVALTIRDPELQKRPGYRCPNAQRDNSCAIYHARPQTCRDFNCGWRVLRFVRQELRPDRSGVLVRLHWEVSSKTGAKTMGIIVGLLNTASLRAEGLAETIAAAVAGNFPVFLTIPGPPGYSSSVARINDAVANAVALKDKPALLEIVRRAYRKGLSGDFVPIVLSPHDTAPAGEVAAPPLSDLP